MHLKLKYKRILIDYLIGWFIASIVWELLSDVNLEGFQLGGDHRVLIFILIWLAQGLIFGLLYIFIDRYLARRVLFIRFLFSSLIFQLLAATIILILVFYFLSAIDVFDRGKSLKDFVLLPVIPVALAYAFITNFVISLVIQINRMLGSNNLLKMIVGQFYTPKTDKRIFMFLDLRGSTTIAEKLGHGRFSRLIQDCFYDLAVVHQHKAEIYQYVGDEAVLVWSLSNGTESRNCLETFFTFKSRIRERTAHYMAKYNVVPEFKAGLNVGEITVAEVGELKKEIAYHGDTINTASRIQDQCNVLGSDLLISENLLNELHLTPPYTFELKGEIQMKGKQTKVKIYAINKVGHKTSL